MDRPLIALAQVNATVGDIDGNAALVKSWATRAQAEGAHLVVFPELTISGYPPEDLLLKSHFLARARSALDRLATELGDIAVLVGFPEQQGARTFNAAALLRAGRVESVYRKGRLPNYGVFDERRYFAEGGDPLVFELGGLKVGVTICEDDWFPAGPGARAVADGAGVVVNLSASPYHAGKGAMRERDVVAARAREYGVPVLMCNLVGGQDELVFDGHSLAVAADGVLVAAGAKFEEELLLVEPGASDPPAVVAAPEDRDGEVYAALVTGLRDYVEKNGFEHVVFGLSGGIDSALVALLAVDALGADRVSSAVMPSAFSADATQDDARSIAANLGIECIELPIEPAREAFREILRERFADTTEGVAEENIQARVRGTLLMALSNKFGWLVLTTGNKSELSVGYSTLYGDLAGGFAVLKDVYKDTVYRLVRRRNAGEHTALVPDSVLTRPPSAELRPDQTDADSLPPYDVLDAILVAYVEKDEGHDEIVARGHASEVVRRVIDLVDLAEYKRRQAPPGVRISPRAFGRDRRMPITNRFRG